MEGEDTPNTAYWAAYRDGVDNLHPSCSGTSAATSATASATVSAPATAPASPIPMDTEEDQDKTVRVVSYREDRGGREQRRRPNNSNGGTQARRETRGDRDRRGDRHRDMREQERERGAARRQRDRAFRARGPPRR